MKVEKGVVSHPKWEAIPPGGVFELSGLGESARYYIKRNGLRADGVVAVNLETGSYIGSVPNGTYNGTIVAYYPNATLNLGAPS